MGNKLFFWGLALFLLVQAPLISAFSCSIFSGEFEEICFWTIESDLSEEEKELLLLVLENPSPQAVAKIPPPKHNIEPYLQNPEPVSITNKISLLYSLASFVLVSKLFYNLARKKTGVLQ